VDLFQVLFSLMGCGGLLILAGAVPSAVKFSSVPLARISFSQQDNLFYPMKSSSRDKSAPSLRDRILGEEVIEVDGT